MTSALLNFWCYERDRSKHEEEVVLAHIRISKYMAITRDGSRCVNSREGIMENGHEIVSIVGHLFTLITRDYITWESSVNIT